MPARIGVPLAVLAVAGVWGLLARRLPVSGPEGPGPGFVPMLLAALLALLGLLLLVQDARAGARVETSRRPGWGQATVVVGLMALYILAMTRVGFVLATPPYVALAVWQCGGRSLRLIVGTALGLTLAVWVLLARLFGVPLP